MFQLAGGKSGLDGQSEDVDEFIRVRTDQMGAKHAVTSFFDKNFEARTIFTDPSR